MTYIFLVAMFLPGCASTHGISVQYVPCEVTQTAENQSSVSMPCLGYSNGTRMGVSEADILSDGKPMWRAILFVDDQRQYHSMKVPE